MFRSERDTAIAVVAEACELGRTVQGAIAATDDRVMKDDRSPVTVADLAIQAVVSRRLAERFPQDALLAEESAEMLDRSPEVAERVLNLVRRVLPDSTSQSVRLALDRGDHEGGADGRYWVLDPIDGTKGFLRGGQYAVALALVAGGEVVVGALGCPNLPGPPGADIIGCMFAAVRGHGATWRPAAAGADASIRVDDLVDPAHARFCESFEAEHAAHSEQAEIARRLGISTTSVRMDSQCKYGVVARGEASIYLRLPRKKDYREKVWDHAAGTIVVEEAGGRVTDLLGRPLDFSRGRLLGNHRGIVASNGRLHDRVLEACREVLGV